MLKISLLISLLISYSFHIINENTVCNIISGKDYIKYKRKKIIISDSFGYNSYFKIKKILNIDNVSFYFINQANNDLKLNYSNVTKLIDFSGLKSRRNNYTLWTFINTKNNNKYIIQNKNKCYIKIINQIITCEFINPEEATEFNIIKLYEEIKKNKDDNKLIEKEPIDVLIKYIDLRDPNLKRNGIHQINKDYDNDELKYSVRSILKYIPWVRKIFILMPNEKVRYFKEYDLIKEKIVYVKDNDILGYDSSNSLAFQFRYWKMKNFGISNNFIIMDDDYFIGNYLKKNDLFYVEKGKVVPAIITSKFINIDYNSTQITYNMYKKRAREAKDEQNSDIFRYSIYSSYLFVLDLFNRSLTIPRFSHNAIPANLKELEEIYHLVSKSKYNSTMLYSLYRHVESLQFQTLVISYTFIKYNKKVNDISYKFIRINNSVLPNYNYSLFCLNTADGIYPSLTFDKAKIVLEYLFPNPTPYEIIDNNSLIKLAFNYVQSIEIKIKNYEEKINKIKKQNIVFYLDTLILLIIILFLIKIIISKKLLYNLY